MMNNTNNVQPAKTKVFLDDATPAVEPTISKKMKKSTKVFIAVTAGIAAVIAVTAMSGNSTTAVYEPTASDITVTDAQLDHIAAQVAVSKMSASDLDAMCALQELDYSTFVNMASATWDNQGISDGLQVAMLLELDSVCSVKA